MSRDEWERFFDFINEIVDSEQSHGKKKAEVLREMKANSADINFEEFVSWFHEDDFS